MRIEPAIFLPTSAGAQAAPGATGGEGFAQLLGLGEPLSAGLAEAPADAATLGKPPPGPEADADTRPAHAFAFGALGLFAPAAGPAGGSAGGTGSPLAAVASVEALAPGAGPEAVAARAADAVHAAGGATKPRDAAAQAAIRVVANRSRATAGSAAAAPSVMARLAAHEAIEAVGAPGAAPRVRPAPTGRPTQARMTVTDNNGKLAVVAAAAHFDPADYGRARARLAEAAANLGASLEDFQINGQAGPAPAIGGPRHGHRAR